MFNNEIVIKRNKFPELNKYLDWSTRLPYIQFSFLLYQFGLYMYMNQRML